MAGLPPSQQNPPPPGPLTIGSDIEQFLEVTDTLKVGHVVGIDSGAIVIYPEVDVLGNLNEVSFRLEVLASGDATGPDAPAVLVRTYGGIYNNLLSSAYSFADYISFPFGTTNDPASDLMFQSTGRLFLNALDHRDSSGNGDGLAEVLVSAEAAVRILPGNFNNVNSNGYGDTHKLHLEISGDYSTDTLHLKTGIINDSAHVNTPGTSVDVSGTLVIDTDNLRLDGHLQSSGPVPTIANTIFPAGEGFTLGPNCTDTCGTLELLYTAGGPGGTTVITFSKPYTTSVLAVFVQGNTEIAKDNEPYIATSTTSLALTIDLANGASQSTGATPAVFSYFIIDPTPP
jgi:hypothetical protein